VGGELFEDRGGLRSRWSGYDHEREDRWSDERFHGECFKLDSAIEEF
jgi:hypothetical protein